MRASLRSKLVLIMLLMIVVLMTVVLAFLVRGVGGFFSSEFNNRMRAVFGDADMISAIENMLDAPDSVSGIADVMVAYSGKLGIDMTSRRFYILDGVTAARLAGAELEDGELLEITGTIMSALGESAGEASDGGSDDSSGGSPDKSGARSVYTGSGADYLDAAAAFDGEDGRLIIYIIDNMSQSAILVSRILTIIIEAVGLGFAVAAAVSLVIGQTLLGPIRGMTRAAKAMAGGDFSEKIPVDSEDEIGTLAGAFNTMAERLESNIEALQSEEKRRRDFVANVSHELKTPLTSVRAYTETVLTESEFLTSEEKSQMLEVVLRESDRMAHIVQDLLQLSRFDADRVTPQFKPFNLKTSIYDVVSAVLPIATARGQTLSLSVEEDVKFIYGDRSQLEQVFVNVITNAIKYTPDGGLIEISSYLSPDGGSVRVSIADTGIGIPPDDLEHVFDRFFRVDKARSRERGGTGLGLSISWEIVTRHGGTIDVSSEVNRGSEFIIELPINAPVRAPSSAPAGDI